MLMVCVWAIILPFDVYMIAFLQCAEEYKIFSEKVFSFFKVVNFCLAFDITVRLLTGYVENQTGTCILEPKKIICNYLKSCWIWVDLYWVYYIFRIVSSNIYTTRYMNVIRLIRSIRLITVLKDLRWISDFVGFTQRGHLITCWIFCGVYLWHFNACLICFVSQIVYDKYGSSKHTWLKGLKERYVRESLPFECKHMYAHAMIEMLSAFNDGSSFPLCSVSTEENITAIICSINAYIINGFFYVLLYLLFESSYSSSLKCEQHKFKLMKYFHVTNTPKSLQEKILDYFSYRYNNHYFQDILYDEAPSLRLVVCIELWKCEIENTGFYKNLPEALRHKIASKLEPEIFIPGHIFYQAEDEADFVYYLCHGTVAVYNPDDTELFHIERKQFFGITMFPSEIKLPRRNYTAIAIDYCEVLMFPIMTLLTFTKKYPKLEESLDAIRKNSEKYMT